MILPIKSFPCADTAISYVYHSPWEVVYSVDDNNFWCMIFIFDRVMDGFKPTLQKRFCTSTPYSADFFNEAKSFLKFLTEEFNSPVSTMEVPDA